MRSTTFGRAFIGGVCTALVMGGAVILAPTASAAACTTDPDPDFTNSRADFDGDGASDVAVGMPYYGDGSGAVDVRGTGSPALVLRAGALGAGTGEGDGFGAEIAMADLDQDGCADLVISAPAEGQSDASDGAGNNEGQVHIVFGGGGGLDLSTSITLPHDSSNLDHFGEKIVVVQRWEGSDRVNDLYVAAPDATVGGKARAGEVFRYTLTPDATSRVKATLREVRSQDSVGVPGAAEAGDRFGASLAGTNRGGVLVGAPDEAVGTVQGAGAIWFLPVNAAGAPIAAGTWSQDSPGVAGAAEFDDHFGATIGAAGNVAVVGVPNEDSGTDRDSGMIQTFNSTTSASGVTTFVPGKGITQDTAGIPGAIEAGDQFGAAVVVGTALACQEAIDAAVGSPGEDIGTKANAGAVTLIGVDTQETGCGARSLRQGSGLAGAAEADDQVGGILGLTRNRDDLEEDYSDRLLIGVPFEDIGAKSNAGMVQPAKGGIKANGTLQESLKYSQGYLLTDQYGMVLPIPVS